jgi:NAD(P)-dependent dehydrogenase (short-subunit alcohol dehydrogenase family)
LSLGFLITASLAHERPKTRNMRVSVLLMPKFDLTDRVAIVTGGSQGIGKGIALGLAEQGAHIVVVSREPEAVTSGTERLHHPANPVVEEIQRLGRKAIGVLADVRDSEQVQAMVARTEETYGRVDILVNNAGASWGETFKMGPLLELTAHDVMESLRLNLLSVFLVSAAVAPVMLRQGKGSIVNMASLSGRGPSLNNGPYGAAKAGVISLTETMAREWGPIVRVNAIAPGAVAHADRSPVHPYAQGRVPISETTALGRAGTVEDIVGAAVYLASDEASYTTGAVLDINGGNFVW